MSTNLIKMVNIRGRGEIYSYQNHVNNGEYPAVFVMVAANERRPYYRTVVLLSVAGSHSPLILCIAVTYLDPECCKLLKKKSKNEIKVRSGFIAPLHNKSY